MDMKMTTRKNKQLISIYAISIILFCGINLSLAQTSTDTVDNLTLKLKQKILLTDEQAAKVTELLGNYIKDPTKENLETAKKELEALLEPRQKAKYNIIKNDWWNSVSEEIDKSRQMKKRESE
jgi:hypothetical protein